MRALLASKSRFAGTPCKLNCGAVIKEGEIVLHQRLPTAAYGDRDFVVHARCMENQVAKAMELIDTDGAIWAGGGSKSASRRRFERMREKILETGNPFIEA